MLQSPVRVLLILIFGLAIAIGVKANEQNETVHSDTIIKEEFNTGRFIIEHVMDSYDWHIVSFGETHISIPLPVILYSKNPVLHGGKSFHIFMSNKFHHAHDVYQGFSISHSKENEGKIVELNQRGDEIGKPIDLSITKTLAEVLVSVVVLFLILLSVARSAKTNKGMDAWFTASLYNQTDNTIKITSEFSIQPIRPVNTIHPSNSAKIVLIRAPFLPTILFRAK